MPSLLNPYRRASRPTRARGGYCSFPGRQAAYRKGGLRRRNGSPCESLKQESSGGRPNDNRAKATECGLLAELPHAPPPGEDRAKIEGLVGNEGPADHPADHQDGYISYNFNDLSCAVHGFPAYRQHHNRRVLKFASTKLKFDRLLSSAQHLQVSEAICACRARESCWLQSLPSSTCPARCARRRVCNGSPQWPLLRR